MKITYFIAVTPPGRVYGAERHHFTLAKGIRMVRDDVDISVLSYNVEKAEDIWRVPFKIKYLSTYVDGIEIHKVPFNNLFIWVSNPIALASQRMLLLLSRLEREPHKGLENALLKLSDYYLTNTGWVRTLLISELLKRVKPDIVHVYSLHLFNMPYKMAKLSLKSLNSKLVVWTIYHHYVRYERLLMMRSRVLEALSRASALISSTRKEAEVIRNLLRRKRLKVPPQHVIPPPIDFSTFYSPHPELLESIRERLGNPDHIVLTMTLSEEKGVLAIIKALSRVRSNEKIAVISFGRASRKDLKSLNRILKNVPSNVSVHYMGFVDEQTKSALYAISDIFVLPSRIDTFGLAYVEAWYYCVPVIGARNPYMEEVIGNMNRGILVDPKNYDELRSAILKLLEDKELSKKLAENGRKFVMENLDPKTIARRVMAVYENINR
ncbi:MAG: glycosyltransferase family 4 protein [Euryarchaeota archaeon]|nr:glycosyltransferase family 4 protein [Euryarchaeota archaeon]